VRDGYTIHMVPEEGSSIAMLTALANVLIPDLANVYYWGGGGLGLILVIVVVLLLLRR
jgi:hypothetical protein